MLFLFHCLVHLILNAVTAYRFGGNTSRFEFLLRTGLLTYFTYYMVPVAAGAATGYMNGYVVFVGVMVAAAICGATYYLPRNLDGKPNCFSPWKSISYGEWLLVGLLSLVLAISAFCAYNLPARTYDVPSYHMTNPMRWVVTGKFVIDSAGDPELSAPMTCAMTVPNMKAMVPFCAMLMNRSLAGTGFGQFPFYVLLILAVRAIAVRLGCKGWAATLVAFGVACMPEVFLQSTDTASDVVSTAGIFLTLWSILVWMDCQSIMNQFCVAASIGVLAGSKSPSVAMAAVLLGFVCLLVIYFRIRKKSMAGWADDAVFALCLVCFVLWNCGSWSLLSWSKFSNPFYPFQIALGSHVVFEGPIVATVNQNLVLQYTGTSGLEAVWNTWREKTRPVGFSSWSGGFGYAAFAFGLPAAAGFLLTGWSRYLRPWVIAHCVIGLLMVISPTHSVVRLVLFEGVWAMVAGAYILTISPRLIAWLLSPAVVAAAIFSLGMALPYINTQRRPPELVAFNLLSGHKDASVQTTFPDEFTPLDFWLHQVAQPGYRLAVPKHFSVWLAFNPARPADVYRVRDLSAGETADQYFQFLRGKNVTHIYALRESRLYNVLKESTKFKLLYRGADGHTGPPWPGAILPKPDSGLFSLVSSS